MKHRTARWKLCILMLLLTAGWQALAGPTGIHPKPKVDGARVQQEGYSLRNEDVERVREPAGAGAPPAGKLSFAKLPLSFEANQGQAIEKVKFLSHGQGYDLFLTSDEAVLEVQDSGVRIQDSARQNQGFSRYPRTATDYELWTTDN